MKSILRDMAPDDITGKISFWKIVAQEACLGNNYEQLKTISTWTHPLTSPLMSRNRWLR